MYRHRNSPPSWLVFLIGIAFVFGVYSLFRSGRDFILTGGIPVITATALRAEALTAVQIIVTQGIATRLPTNTPPPPCQDYVVNVENAIVRQQPSTVAPIVETLRRGASVCVIEQQQDWFLIDRNATTRRVESGYMRVDLLRVGNPTPTPTRTFTPPPTITNTFTPTSTATP